MYIEIHTHRATIPTPEDRQMTVNEIKHQAKLAEWKERILSCRSQGIPVAEWCAKNGYHKTTYYKWEREIFGKLPVPGEMQRQETMEYVSVPTASNQPEFAELAIAAPERSALPAIESPGKFEVAAVIRIGKMEVELSNSISGSLMKQLKELIRLAE